MLGLLSVLREIVGKLEDIVTQLTAIAENTTPADSGSDSEPAEPAEP